MKTNKEKAVETEVIETAITENKKGNIKKKKEKKTIKSFAEKTGKKAKGFWGDFKKFAFKGNIIDLAVAVVIGAAFGAIVTSLVNDIIMPFVAMLIGDVSFTDLKVVLKPANAATGATEIALKYGVFIQKIFEFLIIALSIFLVIRIFNRAKEKFEEKAKLEEEKAKKAEEKKAAAAPKIPTPTEALLTEIRDLLKKEEVITEEKNQMAIKEKDNA